MTEVADVLVTGGDVIRRSGSGFTVTRADVAVTGGAVTAVIPEGKTGPRANQELDASGCLVSPGFVNAHTHSYGMLARGYIDGLPLEPWMPYATAFTVDRTPREIALAATLAGIESLRSGTTTLLDHLGGTVGDLSAAAQAYTDLGVRAVIAPMVGDIPLHRTVVRDPLPWPAALWHELDAAQAPDADTLLRDLADLHAEWDGRAAGRLRIFVGPSGPQRCTRELLAGCARLAEELDTGVHTHLLESQNQALAGRGLPSGSMVGYLDQLGLLSARFSGAHGVRCSDAELALLAERGATLVHNPWSNLNLGSGIAPLPSWRQHGVPAALGTDGANCGGDMRMPLAMRLAANLHRATSPAADWPTVHDVYAMATEGGARALRMADALGAVEPGMAADLVVLETRTPGYLPRHDPIAQLVLGETGDGVRDVLVAGALVLRDRKVLTVNEDEILAEASDAAERITARNSRLFELADAQAPLLAAAAEQAQTPPG